MIYIHEFKQSILGHCTFTTLINIVFTCVLNSRSTSNKLVRSLRTVNLLSSQNEDSSKIRSHGAIRPMSARQCGTTCLPNNQITLFKTLHITFHILRVYDKFWLLNKTLNKMLSSKQNPGQQKTICAIA
jgi:hypothetical protein